MKKITILMLWFAILASLVSFSTLKLERDFKTEKIIDILADVETVFEDQTDTDGDGTPDNQDDFPTDPTEDTDTDIDGTGDNADDDDDADGTLDIDEYDCPAGGVQLGWNTSSFPWTGDPTTSAIPNNATITVNGTLVTADNSASDAIAGYNALNSTFNGTLGMQIQVPIDQLGSGVVRYEILFDEPVVGLQLIVVDVDTGTTGSDYTEQVTITVENDGKSVPLVDGTNFTKGAAVDDLGNGVFQGNTNVVSGTDGNVNLDFSRPVTSVLIEYTNVGPATATSVTAILLSELSWDCIFQETDGDMVFDHLDACDGTTTGLAVDTLGCPTVTAIVAASNSPADGGFDIDDLNGIGITGADNANLSFYEEVIAEAAPAPSNLSELQAIIDEVNAVAIVVASSGTNSLTQQELTDAGVTQTGLNQQEIDAIEAEINIASTPPRTTAELQVIVDNALNILSITDVDGNTDVVVYPNPTSNILNVTGQIKRLEVYNISGQLEMSVNTHTMDVSTLSTGVYFVRITTQKATLVKYWVKQ